MPEWLPKLTLPDIGVFLITVFLCLAAARVPDVGDFIGRAWIRLFGSKRGPGGQPAEAPPNDQAPPGSDAP